MPNYGKFLKELVNNKHKHEQISAAFLSDESSAILQNKVPPKLGDPRSFLIPCNFNKAFSCNALSDLDASINLMSYSLYAKLSLKTPKPTKMSVRTERMIFHIDYAMKHSYSNDDTCFSINVIDDISEEDFHALLDKGSEILHSIKGTILEEKLFAEFDVFMAMTADENSESEFDTEEPPFRKITFNTDYKIKTSLEEPHMDLKLKPLPDNLEYVFLEEPTFLPVIISSRLSEEDKNKLISLLLTPLCCDDTHDVMPRVFALAGCDRLVSEPMVIEKKCIMKKEMRMISKDGMISKFPGYISSKEEEEEYEEEKDEEEEEEEGKKESEKKGSKEALEMRSNSKSSGYAASDNEVESDLESTTRSEPNYKEIEDTCESRVRPKLDSS
nr:reverse transcriptase domain-containing protein [Tanacetum cinerariifolium]